MKRLVLLACTAVFATAAMARDAPKPATASRAKAPAAVELYFIAPVEGATLGREIIVRFGLKGMGVAPAGVVKENTGHHHLLIDTDLPPLDQPIPNDEHHKHFGGGQTETALTLTPGDHTLQLLLGDAAHLSFDPPVVSKKITVHVK